MQKVIKLLSLLFFLGSFLILCKSLLLNFYPDFSQYYYGVKSLNPYLHGIIYPPLAMVIFSSLTLLPFVVSEKLWTVLSLISLFLSVYLIFKIYKQPLFSTFGCIILGLVCFSFPVKFTLGMGQINNFILLIFVAGIYFLKQKKNFIWSAPLLALSVSLKLFPAFIPFYFLLTKKWRFLSVFILSLLVFGLLAFVLVGPKINLYFYQNFLSTLLTGWKTAYYNQALTGFLGRSLPAGIFREALKDALSLIFILISFLVIFKNRKSEKLQNMHLGLLISLNLIVNNFSWQHHFVFMLFPFLATLFYVQNFKKNLKFILILIISYVLISFNLKNPSSVPILLQSHVFYGAVLLWCLEVFLIWKDSHKLQRRFPSALKH